MMRKIFIGGVFALCFCAQVFGLEVISGTFTVDCTKPTQAEVVAPIANVVESPILRLAVSATDNLSGVSGYFFEIDGEEFSVDAPWFVVDCADGEEVTWRACAIDAAGNIGDWSAAMTVQFAVGGDADNDGLPDAWEIAFFGGIEFTDGTLDSDHDGVSDLEELAQGTHPLEVSVSLTRGWNMLALPLTTENDVATDIDLAELGIHLTQANASELVAAAAGRIWTWDASLLRYENTSTPEARQGLWIFSAAEGDVEVSVTGVLPLDDKLSLQKGWNLSGAGWGGFATDTENILAAQSWILGGYAFHNLADPLGFYYTQGYWIYSGETQDKELLEVSGE